MKLNVSESQVSWISCVAFALICENPQLLSERQINECLPDTSIPLYCAWKEKLTGQLIKPVYLACHLFHIVPVWLAVISYSKLLLLVVPWLVQYEIYMIYNFFCLFV